MHRKTFIRLQASLLALLASLTLAHAQQPYFSRTEMPDLIQCLPAPPDTASPEFAHDILRYMWGKTQRLDTLRAQMADRDAMWTRDALFGAFDEAFGLHVNPESTPAIYKVLDNSIATVDSIRILPKRFFHRKRPFERFNEPLLTRWEEEELRGEGSYPSGHTMRGWLTAMLLAEINPQASDAIFARGWQYGESRVIAGAHWQSDVDASRVGASIGFTRLHNSPRFQEEMKAAQEEFQRISAAPAFVSATTVPDGRQYFVSLTEAVPDAILEIRYFGSYNFVGTRIDGYLAPTALMTRQAADSLKAVSDEAMRLGYRIKIYDAYRPQQAVDHFVRWASDLSATEMKPYFYQNVDKSVLFEQGYIDYHSGHTRGSTVDLTLVDMASGKEVDMGGVFDWFGVESHPDFCGDPESGTWQPLSRCRKRNAKEGGLSAEQFANRMILRELMLRHGFRPIDTEWWHFVLRNEPFPDTYFNFPVK